MKFQRAAWWACLLLAGCLLLGRCEERKTKQGLSAPSLSQETQNEPSCNQAEDSVVLCAAFQRKDGTALSRGSASISDGQKSQSYLLDDRGELRAAGLPREGELLFCLYNEEGAELGKTTVNFSTGILVDASTDERGVGYVTLKQAQEEISLVFTLGADGMLTCALRLSGLD